MEKGDRVGDVYTGSCVLGQAARLAFLAGTTFFGFIVCEKLIFVLGNFFFLFSFFFFFNSTPKSQFFISRYRSTQFMWGCCIGKIPGCLGELLWTNGTVRNCC